MAHQIKLAEAFHLMEVGPKTNITQSDSICKKYVTLFGQSAPNLSIKTETKSTERELPTFLYDPHRAKSFRHLLKNSAECPADDSSYLLRHQAEDSARDGPSKAPREQKTAYQVTYKNTALDGKENL